MDPLSKSWLNAHRQVGLIPAFEATALGVSPPPPPSPPGGECTGVNFVLVIRDQVFSE